MKGRKATRTTAQLGCGSILDDFSGVHHQDAIGELTVESRWAMMMAVRLATNVFKPCCTGGSLGISNDAVASSRMRTLG